MPTKVRLVVNVEGYNAYRNSGDVTDLVEEMATTLAERFDNGVESFGREHDIPADGPDSTVDIVHSATRVRAYVRTSSFRARLAESKERLLLLALGGG